MAITATLLRTPFEDLHIPQLSSTARIVKVTSRPDECLVEIEGTTDEDNKILSSFDASATIPPFPTHLFDTKSADIQAEIPKPARTPASSVIDDRYVTINEAARQLADIQARREPGSEGWERFRMNFERQCQIQQKLTENDWEGLSALQAHELANIPLLDLAQMGMSMEDLGSLDAELVGKTVESIVSLVGERCDAILYP